jgi:hypothetical protein
MKNYDFKIDNIKLFDKSSIKNKYNILFGLNIVLSVPLPSVIKPVNFMKREVMVGVKERFMVNVLYPLKVSMLGYGVRLKFKKWAKN